MNNGAVRETFDREGYLSSVEIVTAEEMAVYRREFDGLESAVGRKASQAGTASLHDGLLIHGSNPNRSSRRRCGLTIRFTTPEVAPVRDAPNVVQWKPILVRGRDAYGHFTLDTAPCR